MMLQGEEFFISWGVLFVVAGIPYTCMRCMYSKRNLPMTPWCIATSIIAFVVGFVLLSSWLGTWMVIHGTWLFIGTIACTYMNRKPAKPTSVPFGTTTHVYHQTPPAELARFFIPVDEPVSSGGVRACRSCGSTEADPAARFCGVCGASLE